MTSEIDWIKCSLKLPSYWKYVEVYDRLYNRKYIAKRNLLGFWKYRSGLLGDIITEYDMWRPISND